MKYLDWETGNLPRHTKMSHKLRSLIKMRDRKLLGRYKSHGIDIGELAPVPPHTSQVRANKEYMEKKIAHAEELRKRGTADFFDLMCEERATR